MAAKLGPREVGLDQRHIGGGSAGVLGVAAIDGAAKTTHQRRHLGPDGKLSARARLDQTDAFDAADLRGLRPFAPPHMHFSVVDAERLDFDDNGAGLRLGIGNVPVDEAVEAAELFEDDGAHDGL